MTEPATGSIAASAALATSAGGVALLSTLTEFPWVEYVCGTALAMLGAFAWKFIAAQSAREKAQANGTPKDQLPAIDMIGVGYSMMGAPLASGAVIALVHIFGGQATWVSLPGFLFAGPVAPVLVTRVVGLFIAIIPIPGPGGKTP